MPVQSSGFRVHGQWVTVYGLWLTVYGSGVEVERCGCRCGVQRVSNQLVGFEDHGGALQRRDFDLIVALPRPGRRLDHIPQYILVYGRVHVQGSA